MTENHNSDLPLGGETETALLAMADHIADVVKFNMLVSCAVVRAKLNYGQSGRSPAGVDLVTWGQARL